MKSNGRGGMVTSGANYSIFCSKCGKPAARMDKVGNETRYMHFTKNGSVWHTVINDGGEQK